MIEIMCSPIQKLFATGRAVSLEVGQTVFRMGDDVRSVHLVVEGRIDLVRHAKNGMPLILNRSHPGNVLAEASVYSETYHCDGIASLPSEVRTLPVSDFRRKLHASPEMSDAWGAGLAGALQAARLQSEIRSLKTVADRLNAWLGDNDVLPPKGRIQDLAHILGVSREALYRELARRRQRAS